MPELGGFMYVGENSYVLRFYLFSKSYVGLIILMFFTFLFLCFLRFYLFTKTYVGDNSYVFYVFIFVFFTFLFVYKNLCRR